MADLTITAASVVKGAGARIDRNGYAGETITAGMPVYKASTGFWMKADSNSATALARTAIGIALNGASQYQPIDVQTEGEINLGATLAVGTTYGVSATAGMICPDADIASTNFVTILGVAKTAAILSLKPIVSGIARA